MENGRGKIAEKTEQLERKVTISWWKIGAHKFSTNEYGTIYDIILPIAERNSS
jgi:hypothetical protein